MSGGGGGKAIAYLIETADKNKDTLMVNSTPIVIRSLTGVFPQNFRDLTLVAGTIGRFAGIPAGIRFLELRRAGVEQGGGRERGGRPGGIAGLCR